MPRLSLIPLMVSEKMFLIFFDNLLFMWHRQRIKSGHLDKSHMKCGDYLINIYVKKSISPIRHKKLSISTFPIISVWELQVAISNRYLILPQLNTIYVEAYVINMDVKYQFYPPLGF